MKKRSLVTVALVCTLALNGCASSVQDVVRKNQYISLSTLNSFQLADPKSSDNSHLLGCLFPPFPPDGKNLDATPSPFQPRLSFDIPPARKGVDILEKGNFKIGANRLGLGVDQKVSFTNTLEYGLDFGGSGEDSLGKAVTFLVGSEPLDPELEGKSYLWVTRVLVATIDQHLGIHARASLEDTTKARVDGTRYSEVKGDQVAVGVGGFITTSRRIGSFVSKELPAELGMRMTYRPNEVSNSATYDVAITRKEGGVAIDWVNYADAGVWVEDGAKWRVHPRKTVIDTRVTPFSVVLEKRTSNATRVIVLKIDEVQQVDRIVAGWAYEVKLEPAWAPFYSRKVQDSSEVGATWATGFRVAGGMSLIDASGAVSPDPVDTYSAGGVLEYRCSRVWNWRGELFLSNSGGSFTEGGVQETVYSTGIGLSASWAPRIWMLQVPVGARLSVPIQSSVNIEGYGEQVEGGIPDDDAAPVEFGGLIGLAAPLGPVDIDLRFMWNIVGPLSDEFDGARMIHIGITRWN